MTIQTIPAPLSGKVALVTGGSRGIGAETVLEFARRGVSHLATTYLSKQDLAQQVLKAAKDINPDLVTIAIQADVRDSNCGADVIAASLRGLGVSHLDIVVCNAALQDIADHPAAASITKADFDMVFTAQSWTPLQMSLEAVKSMPPGGRIILCSSGSSKMACTDPLILHSMSKAAMDSIARCLGAIYSKEKQITINSIGVGATATDSLLGAFAKQGEAFRQYCENVSPLSRLGSAKEVANIIAFVASPEASWITCNQVPANGGALNILQG